MQTKISNPYSITALKDILELKGLRLSKRFGQNFLISPHAADEIVRFSGVSDSDTVVEIGTGLMGLTYPICRSALKVFSFEIDRGLAEAVESSFELPENLALVKGDFLDSDLSFLPKEARKSKAVSNLPYSTASQILIKILFERDRFKDATLTFQKEMAGRIMARPSTKDYGTLSIFSSLVATMEPGPKLKPQIFLPNPKIFSQVIRFSFHKGPFIDNDEFRDFCEFTKNLFAYRRKTILNTLNNAMGILERGKISDFLSSQGIEAGIRVESMGPSEIFELFRKIKESFGPQWKPGPK